MYTGHTFPLRYVKKYSKRSLACSTAKCSHHSFPCMLVASTGMKPSTQILPMLPIPWLSAPPKVAMAHHRHVYPHIPGHPVASSGHLAVTAWYATSHKHSTAWCPAFHTMVCACAMVVNGLEVCVRYMVTG